MRIEIRMAGGHTVCVVGRALEEMGAAVLNAKRDCQLLEVVDENDCRHLVNPEQIVDLLEGKEGGQRVHDPGETTTAGLTDDLLTMPT